MSSEIVDLTADDPLWDIALPVLRELRPHLTKELLAQVLAEGVPQGLRFTVLLHDGDCVAIAGWRVIASVNAIRKLYIDDLSTSAAARSHGYGHQLIEELLRRARELGCRALDLDSGVHRHDAHRFYFRERMHITSHHFSLSLE